MTACSSRPVRARPSARVRRSPQSARRRIAASRSWGCASAIRRSHRRSAPRSITLPSSCTGSHRSSTTTAGRSSRAARSIRRHAVSLPRRGARVRARAARRHEPNRSGVIRGSATGSCLSRECSSTPRPCSPRAASSARQLAPDDRVDGCRSARRVAQPPSLRPRQAPVQYVSVIGRVHRDVARSKRLLAHGRVDPPRGTPVFDGLNDESTLGASSSRVAASTV